MKRKLLIILSLALAALLFLYCGGFIGGMRMYSDPKAMRRELLKRIPVGSRIEVAEKIMKENGFGCEMMKDESFAEDEDGDPKRTIVHEREDFLYCGKRKMTWPPVSREWSVAIVHHGGMVSDIYVNTGLTGP